MKAWLLVAALLGLAFTDTARADVVNPLPYDLVYVRAPYFGPAFNPALPRDGNSSWPDTIAPLEPDAGAQLMLLRSNGTREL